MNLSFLQSFLASSGILGLAALGALASDLAGVLNIGLEAFILLGAFSTATLCAAGLPAWLALVLAMGLCAFLAWLMGMLKEKFDADVFMLGIGMNLVIPGGISLFSAWKTGNKTVITLGSHGWGLEPGILALVIALVLAAGLHVFLARTKPGIRLHALSAWPRMLESRGIPTSHYRDRSLVFSGILAGLAGGFLMLQLGSWVPDMSGGRGWIALVLVYAGGRTPLGVIMASLAYAASELFSLRNQDFFIMPWIGLALPYVLLMLFLVLARLGARLRSPGSTGTGT